MSTLPAVAERFLRYVQIDTQSDPESQTVPSTEKQKDLGRLLLQELKALGVPGAEMDDYGYVFATLPSTIPQKPGVPVLALLAHVDTAPDESGTGVKPLVHFNYQGGILSLPGDPSIRLDPARQPALLRHIGQDLITSDGTTLLGSDDKAGVAVLMQLAEDLLHDTRPRPAVRLCFTIDEEIGRGVDKLDLEKLGAQVAYTIDGTDTDMLNIETFNAAEAQIVVKGVMVHPGHARDIMVNAVRILAEMIAQLPPAEAPETTDGRKGYIHPHVLYAGDPASAQVKVILRDFTSEGLQRRKEYVEKLVTLFQAKYPGAVITADIRDQYKNMRSYIEYVDRRAIDFAFAAAEQMGIKLKEEEIRGGTDGSRLSELGLPTPNIFNGGFDYHSKFEWNTVQNLERTLAYVKQLVHYWGENA